MKVLLADDHALFRDGIRGILRPLAKTIAFVEAETLSSVTAITEGTRDFSLLLIDYLLPGVQGLESLRDLVRRLPGTPIVIVSSIEDPVLMAAIIETGVAGFFPKKRNATLFLSALRLVLSGGKYIPEGLLPLQHSSDRPQAVTLTQRQREVLALLLQGASNQEIARAMELSMPTVKMHLRNIFRVLGVPNRMKAAIRARELRLLPEVQHIPEHKRCVTEAMDAQLN